MSENEYLEILLRPDPVPVFLEKSVVPQENEESEGT